MNVPRCFFNGETEGMGEGYRKSQNDTKHSMGCKITLEGVCGTTQWRTMDERNLSSHRLQVTWTDVKYKRKEGNRK